MPIFPGCMGKNLEGQGRGLLAYFRYISLLERGYALVTQFNLGFTHFQSN